MFSFPRFLVIAIVSLLLPVFMLYDSIVEKHHCMSGSVSFQETLVAAAVHLCCHRIKGRAGVAGMVGGEFCSLAIL